MIALDLPLFYILRANPYHKRFNYLLQNVIQDIYVHIWSKNPITPTTVRGAQMFAGGPFRSANGWAPGGPSVRGAQIFSDTGTGSTVKIIMGALAQRPGNQQK